MNAAIVARPEGDPKSQVVGGRRDAQAIDCGPNTLFEKEETMETVPMRHSYLFSNTVLATVITLVLADAAHAVDGVIEINQARAVAGNVTTGDAAGFPVWITEPGSYRLTGDLDAGSQSGIWIQTGNVTLDLNGFAITGDGTPSRDSVQITVSGSANVEVRNGTTQKFGRYGIFTNLSTNVVRVIDVRSIANGAAGIELQGEGNLVRGCTANDNGSWGIRANGDSLVTNNTMRLNSGVGLQAGVGVGYAANVITENNGGNANPQTSSGIEIGANVCGLNTTCP